MKMKTIFKGLLTLSLCSIMACQGDEVNKMGFDRSPFLQHYADNFIVPAYQEVALTVDILQAKLDSFSMQPSEARLAEAQLAWTVCYTSWMKATPYNFGPAGEEGLKKSLTEEIGTWPVNSTLIEERITQSNVQFNDFQRDTRGLLAIEYLLFGNNNSLILDAFANQATRGIYASALIAHVKSQLNDVLQAWTNGYAIEFVANAGTDVGSSTSLFYNEFVKNYEGLKNFKIGIPLGKRAGQTEAEPLRVEALYSGKSLAFLKAHFQTLVDLWYGSKDHSAEAMGWKTYLKSTVGGPELILQTEAQIAIIKTALEAIPAEMPMSEMIVQQPDALIPLHTELQRNVRYFKSDMSSILGIAITYSSGDGD